MKAMRASSQQRATCSAVSSTLMPRASRTSAEPHMLLTDLLPNLQTRAPAAAASTADAVETLIVSAPSPPVPTMSSSAPAVCTGTQVLFIPRTQPASSVLVSPFMRSRHSSAATCSAEAPPPIICTQASSVSAALRSFPSISFCKYGLRLGVACSCSVCARAAGAVASNGGHREAVVSKQTSTQCRYSKRSQRISSSSENLCRIWCARCYVELTCRLLCSLVQQKIWLHCSSTMWPSARALVASCWLLRFCKRNTPNGRACDRALRFAAVTSTGNGTQQQRQKQKSQQQQEQEQQSAQEQEA
jgi:hypothetical protein